MMRGLTIALVVGLAACDPGVDLSNVAPVVTAIGPVQQSGDTIDLTLWLHDREEQPVDIDVQLIAGSSPTTLDCLGGHGTIGLTTDRDPAGRRHWVVCDVPDGVGGDDEIRIRVTATDTDGAAGESRDSDAFRLSEGLPAP